MDFIFQSKRGVKYFMTSAPGPGVYALPNLLVTRKDFNKSDTTSNFKKPIAQQIERVEKAPGPNQYDVCHYLIQN
jgi:hypothetical protein